MGMASILHAGTICHPLGQSADPAADIPDFLLFVSRNGGSDAGQRADRLRCGGIYGEDKAFTDAPLAGVTETFTSRDLGRGWCHAVMLSAQPNPVINNSSAGFSL